ncbi:DNA-binding NarL/FixJ family response regulator [Streptomyces sp. B4I13]|nr:DNA-binding NarL/FixJ family response regulator [Streptomyces sp. B4I13]
MNEGEAERVIRVVVVDDEALVRSGFELILGPSEDIEVVATASGGDAVETVRRERPDVVLLDIRMPARRWRWTACRDCAAWPSRSSPWAPCP